MTTPQDRIARLIERGFVDAHGIAECMVDRDVSNGEYEGCSSCLEIAYTEYLALAEQALERRAA